MCFHFHFSPPSQQTIFPSKRETTGVIGVAEVAVIFDLREAPELTRVSSRHCNFNTKAPYLFHKKCNWLSLSEFKQMVNVNDTLCVCLYCLERLYNALKGNDRASSRKHTLDAFMPLFSVCVSQFSMCNHHHRLALLLSFQLPRIWRKGKHKHGNKIGTTVS